MNGKTEKKKEDSETQWPHLCLKAIHELVSFPFFPAHLAVSLALASLWAPPALLPLRVVVVIRVEHCFQVVLRCIVRKGFWQGCPPHPGSGSDRGIQPQLSQQATQLLVERNCISVPLAIATDEIDR